MTPRSRLGSGLVLGDVLPLRGRVQGREALRNVAARSFRELRGAQGEATLAAGTSEFLYKVWILCIIMYQ